MSARRITADLLDRLERHYIKPGPMPGGVFVRECGLNGPHSQSRVDALYVGFTSASGRLLVGHELKVSRADWRKELDTVGKADLWADNCHEWWIVAPGPDIVPKEEVPHGWGLMYPNARSKTRMDKIVRPSTRPERQPSWLVMRSVLARLDTLRAAHDAEVIRKAVDAARAETDRQREIDARNTATRTMTPEVRNRLDVLDMVEKLLGHEIVPWLYTTEGSDTKVDAESAAAALKLVTIIGAAKLDVPRYYTERYQTVAENMLGALAEFEDARTDLVDLLGKQER